MSPRKTPARRMPETPAEWQDAVDQAAAYRAIHDCKMYGLIIGGPKINPFQCDKILKAGRLNGYRPSRPERELAIELIQQWNASSKEERSQALKGKEEPAPQ